jgi:diguanylate cyclase (GGDEF)-like protein
MLDVDNLSELNSNHGFEMGDRLLEEIAQRIRGCTVAPTKLVRRGGGTFVLLMPQTAEPGATEQAESLRAAVTDSPFALSDALTVSQSVSIGVAAWDGAERPLELLGRADAAMKQAKETGRDRVSQADLPTEDS